jgi:FMN reductase
VNIQVVGVGGSVDAESQSDRALRAVMAALTDLGAAVSVYSGEDLDLPPYHSDAELPVRGREYIEAVRKADAIVIASPGYHGTVSGLVKNALDYLERLRLDERPYLDGRPVGVIAVARGWQAAVATLGTLRQVVHALRGWPTPLGLAINSSVTVFDADGRTDDESTTTAVRAMAGQIMDFAQRWSAG